MSVQPGPTEKRYAANGVSVTYTVPFLVIEAGDLQVLLNGVQVTSGYVHVGVGLPSSAITFTIPPLGDLLLQLSVPFQRLVDYQENGDFLASTVNRDFDRIWQALKQLLRITGRSPLLADNDIDGQGFYRAKGNGMTGLASAAGNPTAATNWKDVIDYVASILALEGPVNSASNIAYVYPDGVARALQTLATKNNALLGSSGIAHEGGTVRDAFAAVDAKITDAVSGIGTDIAAVKNSIVGKNLSPLAIDMHFGTLCGTGWLGDAIEIGGNFPTPTTASSAVSATSTQIPVVDATIFRQGQLICYYAASGTWYTAVVKSITGSTLQLDREIPDGINAGAEVIYFYANDAHPNIHGYKAIADDALRQITRKEDVAYVGKNYEIWAPFTGSETVTGVTLGTITNARYLIPGTSTNSTRAAKVDVLDINQGVASRFISLEGGNYRTHLVLNSGERAGGFSGALTISAEELTSDGVAQVIGFQSVAGYSGIRTANIEYSIRPGSSVRVIVRSIQSGAASFYLGQMKHLKLVEVVTDLNHGVHVCLGDSWFNSGFLIARLQQRLPNATFINSGVSGNRVSQMLARFGTDVTPHKPYCTWLIGGTNDMYADVSASDLSQQINQIAGLLAGIGSQLIAFNCSVGDATYAPVPGERLTMSRNYANNINYHRMTTAPDWLGAIYRSANLFMGAVSIPAGGSIIVGVTPSSTIYPAFIRSLFGSATGLNYRVGYASIIDTATLVDQLTFPGGSLINGAKLPRTDTAARFVVVVANNPTGSAVSTSVVADIAWVNS